MDSLTNLKLKLAEECRRLDGCPRGECFSRRTPKEFSTYEGLEERLANDIAELSNFLNTEIVTSELRNTFKVPVVSVDKHSVMNQTEKRLSFSSPLSHERPTGWSGMKTQLSATQAELRELKENVSERFTLLEKRIEELIEVINKKDNIIYSLKQENEDLHNMNMSVSKASTHNRDNKTNNNLKFHASVSQYKSHGQNNADLSQSNTSEQEIVRNLNIPLSILEILKILSSMN